MEAGACGVWGTQPCCRRAFSDIEVINLDGLPEAEALRLLGLDEQGKDLRGKTGSAAPVK